MGMLGPWQELGGYGQWGSDGVCWLGRRGICTVFVEREDELTNRENKVKPEWGREGRQRQGSNGRLMDIYMKK